MPFSFRTWKAKTLNEDMEQIPVLRSVNTGYVNDSYLIPVLIPKLEGNSSAIAVPKFLVTRSKIFCLCV